MEHSESNEQCVMKVYPEALEVKMVSHVPNVRFLPSFGGNVQIVPGFQIVFEQSTNPGWGFNGDVVYKAKPIVHLFDFLNNDNRTVRMYLGVKEEALPTDKTQYGPEDVIALNKKFVWSLLLSDVDNNRVTLHKINVKTSEGTFVLESDRFKISPRFEGFTSLIQEELSFVEISARSTNAEDDSVTLIMQQGGDTPWMRNR